MADNYLASVLALLVSTKVMMSIKWLVLRGGRPTLLYALALFSTSCTARAQEKTTKNAESNDKFKTAGAPLYTIIYIYIIYMHTSSCIHLNMFTIVAPINF